MSVVVDFAKDEIRAGRDRDGGEPTQLLEQGLGIVFIFAQGGVNVVKLLVNHSESFWQ
ncbi:hypothetical protein [Terrimicrobium sacchariphilum]|uniref:hypothetical protein n=1 Tax=Terrimicrobium sacchariphilum TaxID=690879 RepID=UPI00129A5EB9|nr:hypothetical protein [Terrimicrobium sacchariphilum]